MKLVKSQVRYHGWRTWETGEQAFYTDANVGERHQNISILDWHTNEDSSRYWFHTMEKQLTGKFSRQTIEYCQGFGGNAYKPVLKDSIEWFKIGLKDDMIIERGLSPSSMLEVKTQPNSGRKGSTQESCFWNHRIPGRHCVIWLLQMVIESYRGLPSGTSKVDKLP